ncbi:MAG: hypothetical protein ACRD44_00035 [Bryobacteraceae bacterium]
MKLFTLPTVRPAALAAGLVLLSTTVQAGPPLICHPFDIGTAKSLPWGSGPGWNTPASNYDVTRVTADTLNLLETGMPVIVRMETLRRAAIYSSKHPAVAYELVARLTAKALAAEAAGKPDASAWFDAGYMVETFRQIGFEGKARIAAGVDGYAWTLKAIRMGGDSASMEFAASLMKEGWPNEHIRKARATAPSGSLLARNVEKFK